MAYGSFFRKMGRQHGLAVLKDVLQFIFDKNPVRDGSKDSEGQGVVHGVGHQYAAIDCFELMQMMP